MGKASVGELAPDFTLEGTEGTFTLSEHRGTPVVLLFYPGDETSVCTKQFCSYRDQSAEVEALDAILVGISTKGVESKNAFRANHGFNVPLLADEHGTVADAYGVYAKRLKLTKRATIVVDAQGVVAARHQNFLSLTYDSVADIKRMLDALPSAAGA